MTTALRTGALLFVTFAGTAVAARQSSVQSPSPPSGLIVGRAVDGSSGKPISGAIVSLDSASGAATAQAPGTTPATLGRFPLRVISDSAGRFVFHDLPKGSYNLTGTKAGYITTAYGRRSAGDSGTEALVLADHDQRGDVALPFWKFASISGTVVDEAGEPVVGIQVRVLKRGMAGGKPKFTAFGNMPTTDDRGIYRAASLTPGDYIVGVVTTQTTVPTALQDAFGAAIKNGSNQDFQRELERSRGLLGSIGPTTAGQRVGSWVLQTPNGLGNQAGVPPPIDGSKVFVYPTMFYPAAILPAKATVIALKSGEDRSSIDFQLKPVVTSRISGNLIGPDGPESYTGLDLMPAGSDDLQRDYDLSTASTVTDATGAFTFLGVPPGAYTIRALKIPPRPVFQGSATTIIQTGSGTISSSSGPSAPPPIPKEPTLWATLPVSVGDTDVADVALTFRPGARITGRLEFDGAAQPPSGDRLALATVQIDPADGRLTSTNQLTLTRGVVDATGRFNTYQLPPGRCLLRASGALPGWTFKGATLNGRDVSDQPLDFGGEDVGDVVLTFTDRPTELAGVARNSKGPDSTATVVVFPAQPSGWTDYGPQPRRLRTVRVGSDGSYKISSLPAGDYLAAALTSDLPANWLDAQYLQKISAIGTPVTIGDGEKKVQDLPTKDVR